MKSEFAEKDELKMGISMKKLFIFLLFIVAVVVINEASAELSITGNINLLAGKKKLDEGWTSSSSVPRIDLRDQNQIGILFDVRGQEWPVNIVLDYLTADSDDDRYSLKTKELDYGFRKYFGQNASGTPYIGGGLGYFQAEGKFLSTQNLDKSASGYWVNGGIVFNPIKHVNLGMDVRYSSAYISYPDDILKANLNIGGISVGAFVGYGF
jgi:hypothetical protein